MAALVTGYALQVKPRGHARMPDTGEMSVQVGLGLPPGSWQACLYGVNGDLKQPEGLRLRADTQATHQCTLHLYLVLVYGAAGHCPHG